MGADKNGQLIEMVLIGALSMVAGVVGFVLLNLPGAFDMHERWWRAGVPAAALVAALIYEMIGPIV